MNPILQFNSSSNIGKMIGYSGKDINDMGDYDGC
jgi:hypothetical protein